MDMMKRKFSSIRFHSVRSHLYATGLVTILLLSTLLTIYVLYQPEWLTATSIFTFIAIQFVLSVFISLLIGFNMSGYVVERLGHISVLISQYANGHYKSCVQFQENDEIARIGKEMNELGQKMQTQVKILQRMAEEKAELAQLSHKSAVIEERQRLARDLHDAVSQQLFALTMMTEAAIKHLDENPQLAKEHMMEVAKAAHYSQAEMRALLLHLRPVHLSGDSLAEGVTKLIEEIEERNHIEFKLKLAQSMKLTDSIEEQIFRIIQEALSNILRHAHATKVTLEITEKADGIFVHISDNGKGFDLDRRHHKKTSLGLRTMSERAENLGGSFAIRSMIGQGTYIDIRIPHQ